MRKTNLTTSLSIALALAVTLAVCIMATGQQVRHNYMPGTNFSKYHTYKLINIEGGPHPDQIVDAEIKQAVDTQMASKGFSKVESENADLYVGYQIGVDREKPWNGYGMGAASVGEEWPRP